MTSGVSPGRMAWYETQSNDLAQPYSKVACMKICAPRYSSVAIRQSGILRVCCLPNVARVDRRGMGGVRVSLQGNTPKVMYRDGKSSARLRFGNSVKRILFLQGSGLCQIGKP